MSRCVIVVGADIGNYEHIRSRLRKDDFVVYCDSGLKHMVLFGKLDDAFDITLNGWGI